MVTGTLTIGSRDIGMKRHCGIGAGVQEKGETGKPDNPEAGTENGPLTSEEGKRKAPLDPV
ncbi:hypothetical protein NEMBOFW57_007750 [Staphylotrichum longicolle]|uniref:Uncharacterized protein n=1 Tax=Staphylotrichum longicolle TaxID=669026 RepID=A0AAD4EVN7_9PEZI|nr:hypothetical protein NEMBOFW57_007750 [Staphylotrichum longicolle]